MRRRAQRDALFRHRPFRPPKGHATTRPGKPPDSRTAIPFYREKIKVSVKPRLAHIEERHYLWAARLIADAHDLILSFSTALGDHGVKRLEPEPQAVPLE
jgi:hypothetical protein